MGGLLLGGPQNIPLFPIEARVYDLTEIPLDGSGVHGVHCIEEPADVLPLASDHLLELP